VVLGKMGLPVIVRVEVHLAVQAEEATDTEEVI
jgi:hypothetical protein